jgi:hypothetical protein
MLYLYTDGWADGLHFVASKPCLSNCAVALHCWGVLQGAESPVVGVQILIRRVHDDIVWVHRWVVEAVVRIQPPYRLHVTKSTTVRASAGVRAGIIALAHDKPHNRMPFCKMPLHPGLVSRRLGLGAIVVPLVTPRLSAPTSQPSPLSGPGWPGVPPSQ